jgi:hypothetical protein
VTDDGGAATRQHAGKLSSPRKRHAMADEVDASVYMVEHAAPQAASDFAPGKSHAD